MKIAAMVLGVLGGLLGCVVGFFVYGYVVFIDWFNTEVPDVLDQADNPMRLQIIGLAAPVVAIAGGAMSNLRPLPGAILLAVACAGMFWGFGFGVFTMFPILMTGLAAMLGLLGLMTREPGSM